MVNKSFIAGMIAGMVIASAATAVLASTPWAGEGNAIGVATSADGATVYVVMHRAAYKSTDGGETWVELPVK